MRAFLLDTLNDPTGNTAFCGGVNGGVWKCTNFLAQYPNWTPINDLFDNLAIASICQNPVTPSIIYFATGEATSNADAAFGKGVWKSTNGGTSFSLLPSTGTFIRNFKIGCDAAGNVYLAARTTTTPAAQPNGLMRSLDGGNTWANITPSALSGAAGSCTDFEFTASGNLVAAFGYSTAGLAPAIRVAASPSTVSHAAGWVTANNYRVSNTSVVFTELAAVANTLYAVTINTSYNSDSCYKSTDGGLNWTKQNTTVMPTGLASGQGWYNLTLAINPANTSELISAGLDAYRSTNDGQTWTRITYWVSSAPYVHADHHYLQYWLKNGETRLIMASDGGIYYSTNNGATFVDKNRNLSLKQFYGVAIHPTAGSPYLLAGAQDNGVHQLKNSGLSYSIEVTGGDGCITHINQQNPQIQFGSYVYNQYRRSTNGGATWSSVNLSGSAGLFVNPFDYDDGQNIMYASNGAGLRRWPNANTANTSTTLVIAAAGTASFTAFKVSPYTANRVFIGTNNGKIFKLENANTVVAADIDANSTSIGDAAFPAGNINCINTGTNDNNLVTCFTNYGVNNVWITTNGGTSWTAVDGNLPDMPVRWALYEPGSNTKMYLGTETGVWYTNQLNGAGTLWVPETGVPNVRVSMLKLRASDSTIAAGTYGRGCFTAKIPSACIAGSLLSQPSNQSVCSNSNAVFSVTTSGTGMQYQWQVSTDGGTTYTDISGQIAATLTLTNVTVGMNNNRYRCVISSTCTPAANSNPAILTVTAAPTVTTQPVNTNVCVGKDANIVTAGTGVGLTYQWQLSTNGGANYNNITGATNPTYTVTNATFAMNGNMYRCVLGGTCTPPAITNEITLTVSPAPVVTLGASPYTRLFPGLQTFLLVGVSPNAGQGYVWYKNNVLMPGVNTDVLKIDIDGLGTYRVTVTDVNGCTGTSNSVTISDSVNNKLFIYPNPNNGNFQVRYYAGPNDRNAKSIAVFDSKGARVFSQRYSITGPYDRMAVDMRYASSGVYLLVLFDNNNKRIASARVLVKQ
jgi:photosystem II stability/assembly factor-like uncharacterized protein